MLVGLIAMSAALMLPACEHGSDGPAIQTICYPVGPSVGSSEVVPGATVVLASVGFGPCPSKRLRFYGLQLRRAATGFNMRAGERLRTVKVAARIGSFETTVRIPPDTKPGRYIVSFSPAPEDDYDYTEPCDDTTDCAPPPQPNLIVVSRPTVPQDAHPEPP